MTFETIEAIPVAGALGAGMYAAYDALSDGIKATLDGLTAVHKGARRLRHRVTVAGERPAGTA